MTLEQELIAEKVIQLHKVNNGIYDWADFVDVFNTTHDERLVIARTLRDKDFIGDHTTGTRLKDSGWVFKGFEAERQKDLADKERQSLKDEKLGYEVENARRIFKTYWWTFAFAIIALIISLSLLFLKLLEASQQAPVK